MNTVFATKGDFEALEKGIDLELMRKFCQPMEGNPHFEDVFNSWNYRGREPRVNYDLVATNGRVLLCVEEVHLSQLKEGRANLSAEYWWAMSAIRNNESGVIPARPRTLKRIDPETLEEIKALPRLEFVEVSKVLIWNHGRRATRKWHKVDDDKVVFFRFAFGVGCCAAASKKRKAPASE